MVYKDLTDRCAPRQELDPEEVPESDKVRFGTAFAFSDEYIRQWRINNKEHDPRLCDMGTIASVKPVFLDDDVTNPLVITLHLVPENSSLQSVELSASLLLKCETLISAKNILRDFNSPNHIFHRSTNYDTSSSCNDLSIDW